MHTKDNLILVGIISSVHGIQGCVAIKSFTSPITNILKMDLVNAFSKMDKSSLATYAAALRKLRDCFNTAFSESNVKQGWEIAGLWPLDDQKILERCTTWGMLEKEQQEAIVKSISCSSSATSSCCCPSRAWDSVGYLRSPAAGSCSSSSSAPSSPSDNLSPREHGIGEHCSCEHSSNRFTDIFVLLQGAIKYE